MKNITYALIICFWAVMTSFYVRDEILPSLPELSEPSYETFFKAKTVTTRTRMGIYYGSSKLGESVTNVVENPDGSHTISNVTNIMFAYLFGGVKIEINGNTNITQSFTLDSFDYHIKSSAVSFDLVGKAEGDDMVIDITTGGVTETKRIPGVSKVTLSNGISPFIAMPNLSVGKEWTITVVNPLDGTVENVRAFVETKDKMEWKGQVYDVYEVVLDYKNFKPRAWIAEDGRVLKEELLVPGLYLLREGDSRHRH